MGNRAIITTKDKQVGIYLHWNGGRDSVEAFLEYCKLKGFRSPEADDSYAFARLTQVISNFFEGGLSIGILGDCSKGICEDNGNYIIGSNWEIINREYPYKNFNEQNEYNLKEMLKSIDKAQPVEQQLGDFLCAKEKNVENLRKGDIVYIQDYDGIYEKFEVVGFGKDNIVNGINVLNKPYVNKYGDNETCMDNINNYILTDKIKIYDEKRLFKKEISEEMEAE